MVSMFLEIEKLYRKKFIQLYEEFLENPLAESMKKKADGMGALSGPELSEKISKAAIGAYKMELGQMTIKEAKEILEALKKEDEED